MNAAQSNGEHFVSSARKNVNDSAHWRNGDQMLNAWWTDNECTVSECNIGKVECFSDCIICCQIEQSKKCWHISQSMHGGWTPLAIGQVFFFFKSPLTSECRIASVYVCVCVCVCVGGDTYIYICPFQAYICKTYIDWGFLLQFKQLL